MNVNCYRFSTSNVVRNNTSCNSFIRSADYKSSKKEKKRVVRMELHTPVTSLSLCHTHQAKILLYCQTMDFCTSGLCFPRDGITLGILMGLIASCTGFGKLPLRLACYSMEKLGCILGDKQCKVKYIFFCYQLQNPMASMCKILTVKQ